MYLYEMIKSILSRILLYNNTLDQIEKVLELFAMLDNPLIHRCQNLSIPVSISKNM